MQGHSHTYPKGLRFMKTPSNWTVKAFQGTFNKLLSSKATIPFRSDKKAYSNLMPLKIRTTCLSPTKAVTLLIANSSQDTD